MTFISSAFVCSVFFFGKLDLLTYNAHLWQERMFRKRISLNKNIFHYSVK